MKLEITPTTCCELCSFSVCYNHVQCPVCDKYEYLSWSIELQELDIGDKVHCEGCLTEFEIIKKADFLEDWEWEIKNEKERTI